MPLQCFKCGGCSFTTRKGVAFLQHTVLSHAAEIHSALQYTQVIDALDASLIGSPVVPAIDVPSSSPPPCPYTHLVLVHNIHLFRRYGLEDMYMRLRLRCDLFASRAMNESSRGGGDATNHRVPQRTLIVAHTVPHLATFMLQQGTHLLGCAYEDGDGDDDDDADTKRRHIGFVTIPAPTRCSTEELSYATVDLLARITQRRYNRFALQQLQEQQRGAKKEEGVVCNALLSTMPRIGVLTKDQAFARNLRAMYSEKLIDIW